MHFRGLRVLCITLIGILALGHSIKYVHRLVVQPQEGPNTVYPQRAVFRNVRGPRTSLFKTGKDEVDLNRGLLSDDELLQYVNDCRQEHPSVIYYNRVPKCGSRTMMYYISQNADNSKKIGRPFAHLSYTALNNNTFFHPIQNPFALRINDAEVTSRVKEILRIAPAVVDSHTYYISYLPINAHHTRTRYGDIAYFNMVREPLARLISFKLFQCRWFKQMCTTSFTQDSNNLANAQVAFICGHQEECKKNDEISLYIAKVRLVATYSLVGITEKMTESAEILKKVFPDFFRLDYDGTRENVGRTSRSSLNISSSDINFFKEKNGNDISFYSFALKVFKKKKKLCGVV